MGDSDSRSKIVFPARVAPYGMQKIVTEVSVAEQDENGRLTGDVQTFTSSCAEMIKPYQEAWQAKIDSRRELKGKPELSASRDVSLDANIKKTTDASDQACSVQGWKWKRKETEFMKPESVAEEARRGGFMLENGANRELYLQVALQAADLFEKK